MVILAAIIFAALCALVVAFQFALILGAPWGYLTQGGSIPGALPPARRVAAAASICLMTALAAAILGRGGFDLGLPGWSAWAAFGISLLSLALNMATPSRAERRLWAPVAALLAITSGIVVLAPVA